MAFIIVNSGTEVLSFAEYEDITNRDGRLFAANEGLTSAIVEDLLIRSTERILTQIRATGWWVDYYINQNGSTSYSSVADIPAVDAINIKARQNDFTDLCVYSAMYEYVLPKVANFGDEEDATFSKIGYYETKFNNLFDELIEAGDWYDFSGDGTIVSSEKQPGIALLDKDRLVRVR
tara:strand:- start:397 stop:927 length:531 start_codon:yes stop_codon:yes gene_type:complete